MVERPGCQRGVALLTVLLVVFLASTVAVALATLETLGIRRQTLFLHQQQARYYLLGAEAWAAAILDRDLAEGDTDSPDESWAAIPPALPVQGGVLVGRIEDLQGRFNLNSLLQEDAVDAAQLAFLRRILEELELDPPLADAIADWLDPDQETRFPGGAEDGEYVAADIPYLAANRAFASITELRLVRGVDAEVYRALAPFVSALPPDAGLNLNTAAGPLLAALVDDAPPPSLVAGEGDTGVPEPLTSVDQFLGLVSLAEPPVDPARLTVASRFFLLRASAEVGSARATLNSVLARPAAGGTRSLRRSFGADW